MNRKKSTFALLFICSLLLASCSNEEQGLTPEQIRQTEGLYRECLSIAFNNNGTIEEQTAMAQLCKQIELG